MYTYRSKCRFKMLIFGDGRIIETSPNQTIKTIKQIDNPHLVLISPKKKQAPVIKENRQVTKIKTTEETLDAST